MDEKTHKWGRIYGYSNKSPQTSEVSYFVEGKMPIATVYLNNRNRVERQNRNIDRYVRCFDMKYPKEILQLWFSHNQTEKLDYKTFLLFHTSVLTFIYNVVADLYKRKKKELFYQSF
jgi:23S rRNA maturation-related 3'-5' exoribonuclease YhaM